MAPAVIIDTTPDLDMDFSPPVKQQNGISSTRTLLLAPPSVASHPSALSEVAEAYDRSQTDIQMLDRLALGLVSLPDSTYDTVLILTDVDRTRTESSRLLNRDVMSRIVASMKPGGRLKSQDGTFGTSQSAEQTEAILAGLTSGSGEGMIKPDNSAGVQSVKLNFRKKKADAAAIPANDVEAINTGKRKVADLEVKAAPAGVGFIDTADDLNDGYEDDEDEFPSDEALANADRIDPDTLLTEEDRQKPLNIPEACKPNTKRRRACKDCTCGLAERIEAEDKAKRVEADNNLKKLNVAAPTLGQDDLAEVDFTVQGKVGSCGNCALGDAFRCDGCPYIGLPAFKPGEEVRLLQNDVQL
ncbi:Fe-S cluster assembly protein dre2 [Pseudocercospora fuligena]|uniref:Fe-S cluster assembly protein dre2 n=1 Tax=Pseudocercospora fuligena TaxID=685502 RepID=A0A8H6R807_9PEZI|nr:Fe-S cluster assembly protein dre2 [Pseudocercospora fuligena]